MTTTPARLLSALAVACSGLSAQAAPVAIGSGAFTSPTVVDFNAATDGVAVGSLYSGSGVTFTGALLGMTNSGDTSLFPSSGGVIASNWNYRGNGSAGLSFTATFASLVTQVGFELENWPTQTATVELFAGNTSLGTLALANNAGLPAEFRGIADSTGFDSMVFTNTANLNGFFAIDNLQFSGSQTPPIPEPTNVVLMLAGLAALGLKFKARKA